MGAAAGWASARTHTCWWTQIPSPPCWNWLSRTLRSMHQPTTVSREQNSSWLWTKAVKHHCLMESNNYRPLMSTKCVRMKWNQNIFLSRVLFIHTTATVCVSVSENKEILLWFTFSHNYVLQDDVLPFIIITGYPSTSKSSWGFIFTVNSILLLTQFRNSEHQNGDINEELNRGLYFLMSPVLFS